MGKQRKENLKREYFEKQPGMLPCLENQWIEPKSPHLSPKTPPKSDPVFEMANLQANNSGGV